MERLCKLHAAGVPIWLAARNVSANSPQQRRPRSGTRPPSRRETRHEPPKPRDESSHS
jgi:hypothetical protein